MPSAGPRHKNRVIATFICKVIGTLLVMFVIIGEAQQPGISVLLPESAAETAPICRGKSHVCEGWKPTKEDIQGLEANLSQVAHLKPDRGTGTINHLGRYFRQYVAVRIAEQNLIYVNAFCSPLSEDWQKNIVVVSDGGTCFWQALYNPKTKRFSHLMINGLA